MGSAKEDLFDDGTPQTEPGGLDYEAELKALTAPADHPRRCKAHRAGSPEIRCKRWAVRGSRVCAHHGGAAPQVVRAAKMRLLELVDPAITALLRTLTARGSCPSCGRSEEPSAILRAAIAVLDRTDLGPRSTIALEKGDGSSTWAQYLSDEQVETVARWIEEAKQRQSLEEGVVA